MYRGDFCGRSISKEKMDGSLTGNTAVTLHVWFSHVVMVPWAAHTQAFVSVLNVGAQQRASSVVTVRVHSMELLAESDNHNKTTLHIDDTATAITLYAVAIFDRELAPVCVQLFRIHVWVYEVPFLFFSFFSLSVACHIIGLNSLSAAFIQGQLMRCVQSW